MKIVVYNNNKIKKIISVKENAENTINLLKKQGLINTDDNYKIFDNIKDMSVKDIRAIGDDGTVMSLEEQIKNKILVLEKDEEIRNGVKYKLNKNYEEDFIKLVELRLEKIDDRQKIVTNEDGSKYITSKTYEELFKENLITAEEYNNYIIQQRQGQYQSNLDGVRAELVDSVLNNLASQGLLTEEQKSQLESLHTKREEIKTEYPKQS
ncbi:phage tail protein [Brachyspira hampsonii]|uniref:phage tail protein n=1 Tax=Brachyspira hampsonii TaxID=1287055 RepID=UPI000D38AE61|nr:phage tail protein [Brachyspira hampsonii]PTY39246.1 Hvp 28 VSH-1 tail protein [Brachyspira hampsonii bv. II]